MFEYGKCLVIIVIRQFSAEILQGTIHRLYNSINILTTQYTVDKRLFTGILFLEEILL